MFAVIRTGSKQYLVRNGEKLTVEKISKDDLKSVEVLAVGEGASIEFGKPTVSGAKVVLDLVENFKGPKVISAKFRAKKHSKTRRGHRQNYTKILVKSITK